MSDDNVQTYGNHARWLPPFHFFALPVLLINVIVTIVALAKNPSLSALWGTLVAAALAVAVLFSRWMPLRAQDRIIMLEEMLRLERLLPGRYSEFERLTREQLIGIRFASDSEVPHLVDRILEGELVSRDDVKRAVQHWRPDHLRA